MDPQSTFITFTNTAFPHCRLFLVIIIVHKEKREKKQKWSSLLSLFLQYMLLAFWKFLRLEVFVMIQPLPERCAHMASKRFTELTSRFSCNTFNHNPINTDSSHAVAQGICGVNRVIMKCKLCFSQDMSWTVK